MAPSPPAITLRARSPEHQEAQAAWWGEGRNLQNIGFTTIVTACYWGDNGQEQGIGYNQAGTGGTTQVDGDWQNAVTQMNAALSGKGWQYELKDGNSLPILKKQ